MKYEVVKGCRIKGQTYRPGDVLEIDSVTAGDLMGIGRIVPHDESKAANRAVGLESSEEKPKKRGRTKKEAPKPELVVEQDESPEAEEE